MFTFISNPDNKSPDVKVDRGSDDEKLFGNSVSDNVQWSFIAFAIVAAVVGVIGVLLMHERELPDLKDLPKEFRSNMTLKQCLKTNEFWTMILAFFFTYFVWGYMANDYKVFGLTEIDNDHLLSYAGSTGSAIGIVARIF
mmetsp:Transcript_9133/g.1357  ORF Transcript_9133/g.1357 Transcript_9133/m.1357 type:complete len:140 (-) Transcript_9133:521-940(-)